LPLVGSGISLAPCEGCDPGPVAGDAAGCPGTSGWVG